jgi:SAM-dependent methyltransferase
MSTDAARSWDAQYVAGRYRDEPPVPFVPDILAAARAWSLTSGLYIGCGNGRNLIPMVAAGLDLTGLDISDQAITQLRQRLPDRAGKLVTGDLSALPAGVFELVIGIQVFQHGTREQAHAHLSAAAARVAPGGLLCVRVNAVGTDLVHDHDRIESAADGSFTVRYRCGPKAGLNVHFFAEPELRALAGDLAEVLPLRLHHTKHTPPRRGQWSQWEAIWRRLPA